MRPFCLILISLVFYVSCSKDENKTHVLDFKKFTIEVPKSWKKLDNLRGVDSYVGGFVTEDGDSIIFDLGPYSNALHDEGPSIMEKSMWESVKNYPSQIDSTQFVIVEDTAWVDYDFYRKRNLRWDTIDGRLSKIVFPVRPGDGITGIYIDSLGNEFRGKIRFNLSGFNLKPKNGEILLEAIRTIKFSLKDN